MASLQVVGKRVPMKNAWEKATGWAKFAADVECPGMLVGKILRSPHAHARILNVDAGRAERQA